MQNKHRFHSWCTLEWDVVNQRAENWEGGHWTIVQMDKRLCQQNVPKLTFLLKIHIAVMERRTPVTREESDAKLSYRWKKKSRKGLLLWSFSYKDHNTTGAKQQLKGFVFRERKLDISPSLGLQEERLWSARSACFSRDDQRRGKTVESGNGARICRSAGELGLDLTYLLHFSIIGRPSPSLLVSQVL